MNELSGKKDTESTALSEAERRSLMSGSKAAGPTLAITNGSSSATDTKPGTTTIGSTSFNANGAMKTDYVRLKTSHCSLMNNVSFSF